MMLPTDVFDIIAVFSGRSNVIHTLKHHLTPQVYDAFHQKNVSLVYGQVQSGKTAMIMSLIRKSPLLCVLVIQNSLLVLKQYLKRFADSNIQVQTVNSGSIHSKVVLVMHNSSQYRKFLMLKRPDKFSLFMDESDLTRINPLSWMATNRFHITATPFKYKHIFDRIICVSPPPNYYGLERVQILPKPCLVVGTNYKPIIQDFTSSPPGILLITEYGLVQQMNDAARCLSKHVSIPIIVLSSVKKSYIKGRDTTIYFKDVQSMIDSFKHKHIIIIANRMASRGLSFTSSDFSRHITHQVFGKVSNITSFIQKCRIFGVYTDSPTLKMYLPEDCLPMVDKFKQVLCEPQLLKPEHDLYYYQN